MSNIKKLALVIFLTLIPLQAMGHKPSDSYLTIKDSKHCKVASEMHSACIRWDIALKDLEYAIGIDSNSDGKIIWKEVKSSHKKIKDLAFSNLEIKVGNSLCDFKLINQQIDNHSDGAYTVLNFKAFCPDFTSLPEEFTLNYGLFFDIDEEHHGLVKVEHENKIATAILTTSNDSHNFKLDSLSTFSQFVEFVKEGIWHIWIGIDHILFLLALLLPSVLIWKNDSWIYEERFNKVFLNVLKIITAFTIAHSVTLTIAALEIVHLPSRLVESIIALSVAIAALNNLFPFFKAKGWIIAFSFGLIHGFGFANVLMDLSLPQNALILSLFGFNVGVEIGQLAIVALFLPLIFSLRKTPLYKTVFLFGGSGIIILISILWFIERAFNLSYMPF